MAPLDFQKSATNKRLLMARVVRFLIIHLKVYWQEDPGFVLFYEPQPHHYSFPHYFTLVLFVMESAN